jgi:acyl-CoA thioester hydrolase
VDGFNFSTEIAVRFAETDAQGIAHHANYVIWFEVARIDYLARFRDGYRTLQAEGIEVLVTDVGLSFAAPARFDDRLRIHARCVGLKGARFRFEYVVEHDGSTIGDGFTAHACVSAGTFLPTRTPPWLVEAITTAEG